MIKSIALCILSTVLAAWPNAVNCDCLHSNVADYVSDRAIGLPHQEKYLFFSNANTCQTSTGCFGVSYDNVFDDFEYSGEEGNIFQPCDCLPISVNLTRFLYMDCISCMYVSLYDLNLYKFDLI